MYAFFLPHVEVIGVLVDAPDELVVAVQSGERRPLCPNCGKRCGRVHDRRDVKIRDVDNSCRSVTLVWQRRRLICDACSLRFSEHNATFERGFTVRLACQLVTDARDMPIKWALQVRSRDLAQTGSAGLSQSEHRVGVDRGLRRARAGGREDVSGGG